MKDGNPKLHREFALYLGIPVSIIGLIGNFISVLVWSNIIKKQESSRKSASIYLITLAFVDSFLLICFLTYDSLPELFPAIKHNIHFVVFSCYAGYPLYFFSIVASIWMIIGVTVNRFIAVIFPYRAENYNSVIATRIVIFITIIFSFIINIPHFFNYHPVIKNGTASIVLTSYGKTNGAQMYDLWVHCMFLVLVPWLAITIMNSLIIHKVIFKTRIQKHKKNSTKKLERQMTITLLVVTISFLVFLIWRCIAQCFWMFHYGMDDPKKWYIVSTVYAPARLGVVINASMNFTFYCLSGSFFRKEMKRMLGCFAKDDYSSFTSSTPYTAVSSKVVNSAQDEVIYSSNNKTERSRLLDKENDPIV